MKLNHLYKINHGSKRNLYVGNVDDFVYFLELDLKNRVINFKLLYEKINKFHTLKETVNSIYEYPKFSSMDDFFNTMKQEKRLITIEACDKENTGFIVDIDEDYLLLHMITIRDGSDNGYLFLAKDDIERIDWNGDYERRLEGLAKYPILEKKLQDFYGGISDGEQICEIYSFYEENFALGRAYNIEDKYFLIDHINLLGEKEGLILIRNKDIDYFCFETQYIKTFPTLEAGVKIETLVEFLEYLKQNQIPIEITTGNKTYDNVLLTEYNDKYLIVSSKKRRIKVSIEKITEIDSTIMN